MPATQRVDDIVACVLVEPKRDERAAIPERQMLPARK
jgi:hypothetical protein